MKNYDKKQQYLFLVPLILVLLTVVAYPFCANVVYSFMDYKLTNPVKTFIFLDNYIKIFTNAGFDKLLYTTLVWTLCNLVLTMLLGVSVGLLLDSRIKGKIILQSVLLIPWVIPETVTAYTWKWMMSSDYGILNRILYDMHIIDSDFSWFRTGNMAMLAVILANTWRSFPFLAVMVFAKKKSMPPDWTEAAMIDGANTWQVFRHITVPYIQPVITRVTMLIFIWSYNAFGIIYTMTEGGPLGSTTTFPIYIQKTAFEQYDFGITSAMSVVMMICMVIILFGFKTVPKWVRAILGLKTAEED